MVRSVQGDSVPHGWKYDYLDNFTVRGSGHTPNKEKPEYWNGGVKWVSLSDSFNLDKGLISETDKEISDEGIKNSSAVIHPAGTVILSRDAGVGKSAVLASKMAVSQHFMAWRCDNSSKMNSWFLYNWLQVMKPEFERQAVGSTIKTIGLPYFKKLKIAVPPYSEQISIAKILSVWDKAIMISEQLFINSQQYKKHLTQELLTQKKRLPGFSKKIKHYHFSDLLTIDAKNLDKNTPDNFEFNYISLSDVENGRISSKLERHKFHSAPSRARRIVDEDDILLATVRPNSQGFAKIKNEHADLIASTGFSVLTRRENVCADYVYHYLFSAHITSQINSLVVGTNYPAINSSDVSGLSIYCPEYEEQKEIAEILNNCDSMIYQLQHKIACLKKEKRALTQQLLTGKRRVIIDRPEPA